MVQHSLTDDEFVDEVRTAVGDLGESIMPTDTILQQWKRQVKPFIEDNTSGTLDQDKVDNAAIFGTAEAAFKSWVQKDRMTTSGQDTYIDNDKTIENLEDKAARSFSRLDITYQPSRGPAPFSNNTEGFYS